METNYLENGNDIILDDGFDFKKLLFNSLRIWYVFLLLVVISIIIAFYINKYSTYEYEAKTTLLINSNSPYVNSESVFGISFNQNQRSIKNEVAILKSYSLASLTIKKLDFEISYFNVSKLPHKELYKNSPFRVEYNINNAQIINIPFQLSFINDSIFEINAIGKSITKYNYSNNSILNKVSSVNIKDTFKFGEFIQTENFAFKIIKTELFNINLCKEKYEFVFNSIDGLINRYKNVSAAIDDQSSVILLSMKGGNVRKMIVYLNTLVNEYLNREVEKKNQIAINTLFFINSQLTEMLDSLNSSGILLQDFQSNNQIIDAGLQTNRIFSQMEELQNNKAILLVKKKYYQSLYNYLKNNEHTDDIVAPSAIGINDPLLNRLLMSLINLYSEKSSFLVNSIKSNPQILSIEMQIESIRESLLVNIENLISVNNLNLDEIEERINYVSEKMNELPKTQRELFGYQRKFKLNDAIYTFLLQKRAETQIAKASNIPIHEILDPAMLVSNVPVYPKKKKNYIIAILIGFLLPVIYLIIKDYFYDKIDNYEDINKFTKFPIIGNIIHNSYKNESVVSDFPLSTIAESFRSIRTNFQFIADEKKSNVVLVTSSMKGEGKSFSSINLASSFALNNKKVVLLLFDLRNPKLYIPIENKVEEGISNYLINKVTVKEIICNTSIENLDVIHTGPLPPNPTELISMGRTGKLIEDLKLIYDFVIIDTPPIGIVSDFLLLYKYSDIILFLVRQNYTPIKMLKKLLNDFESRNIDVNLIINDIKFENSYLGYKYGYNYGYGYNYKNEEKTKNNISKLLSFQYFKSNFNLF